MYHSDNQILAGFYHDLARYTASFLADNRLQKLVIKLENPQDKKVIKGLLNNAFDFIASSEDEFIEIKFGRAYLTAEYVSESGEFTFDDYVKSLYHYAYLDDMVAMKSTKKALFKESLDYGLAYLRLSK